MKPVYQWLQQVIVTLNINNNLLNRNVINSDSFGTTYGTEADSSSKELGVSGNKSITATGTAHVFYSYSVYYRNRIKCPMKTGLSTVEITISTLDSCDFSDILFCLGSIFYSLRYPTLYLPPTLYRTDVCRKAVWLPVNVNYKLILCWIAVPYTALTIINH